MRRNPPLLEGGFMRSGISVCVFIGNVEFSGVLLLLLLLSGVSQNTIDVPHTE